MSIPSNGLGAIATSELDARLAAVVDAPTHETVSSAVHAVLTTFGMSHSQLAAELDVAPATVARWLAEKRIPHSRELRKIQQLVRKKLGSSESQCMGVDFQGRRLQILTFDEFFSLARGAKNVFVLKGLLGFQAGVNTRIRGQLKALFAENKELRIHYGFLHDSEAAMTFSNFQKEVATAFRDNIRWKAFADDDPVINRMLGGTFASPFIIEYKDGHTDILLEIPVKILSGDQYDYSGYTTVLVGLPETHKFRLWKDWRDSIEGAAWQEPPQESVVIQTTETFDHAIDDVRRRAYGLDQSTIDEFDNHSFFVIAQCDGKTVGTVRLTPSEKASPLRKWGGSTCLLPTGSGVVELTRGTVDPDMQGRKIYQWMMLKTMREAARMGYRKATAAIEKDFPLTIFLFGLGFELVGNGEISTYNDTPRIGTKAKSLVCNITESQKRWNTVEENLRSKTKIDIRL